MVTNTGTDPITFLSVCAEAYNNNHVVVDQSIDIPISEIALKPGETAKWALQLHDRDNDEITSYEIKVEPRTY